MLNFALEGLWLLGGLAAIYLAGVFTSQWAKDKLFGVPADLRSAIRAMEAMALTELSAAKSKIVADTVTLLAKGKAAAASAGAPAPAPAPVPVPAAAPAQ